MLHTVTQGREVVIDPLTGNSYYQSSHSSTTLKSNKSLFDITPIQERSLTEAGTTRLTLDNTACSRERNSSVVLETNSFHSQPLITNSKCCKFWSQECFAFSKSDIKSAVFINQIDKKFLCCILSVNNKDILVLFDQHAVHERIRLESLLSEVKTNNQYSIPNSQLLALQSKACHGAIKFGDKLDRNCSIKLLDSLTKCNLPFQCAHGRPSIAPLLNISNSKREANPYRFECNKLRKLHDFERNH
ncbi:hypothetical protein LOD99_13526 [Oopsacas minuta]|uniref:MutL C-terminal dimerisation domain-containing protein n=1 Tax=Oopsacas minuta TaxID=111878 RepID=A0AAV7KK24_9METZ|nr:hypothetical protein LOD99_13526 [Oopsacas minuta]